MFRRLGALKSVEAFRAYAMQAGALLPIDDRLLSAAEGSPLARPLRVGSFTVGNRFCVQPMEGWDGTRDGRPTERTLRRWSHFGESGAKLIWGGEAFAVRRDGRANPNQLYYSPQNVESIRQLHDTLIAAHRERFGPMSDGDLLIGLQLTHSGRFCFPDSRDRPEPRIAYRHPILDRRLTVEPHLITDGEVGELIDDYVAAAKMAREVGFAFVDVKACHGYLGHEFLSAFDRPGLYGGDFLGRTRFLRDTIARIRDACPGLLIGVRLSLFDTPPFSSGGVPEGSFRVFGDEPEEPIRLLKLLHEEQGVELVNLTAGSPYYNPHVQRPAAFPPSDGYPPPEDPLIGCARQLDAVRRVKQALPALPVVGSAYSYFQEFLPHVAQPAVREGWTDFIGLGRTMLSYWGLPADLLEGRGLQSKRWCRTFSDCTTAPRNGLPSGCYPLDDYYKDSTEAARLKAVKVSLKVLEEGV